MKRNFGDFISAYMDYAKDSFCPPDFHLWTALSLLAGSVERKVWSEQIVSDVGASVTYYPNLYVLLVSHPGGGKSTALGRGVELLEDLKREYNPDFKLIPNQITEPRLIEAMTIRQQIQISANALAYYSSGYFYASEASASALQNLHGNFNSTITEFYDCPKVFRKSTKIDGNSDIDNICFNVFAGSTFDYLKELVNERSVMGGLASRFIYVIQKDRFVREAKLYDAVDVQKRAERMQIKKKLVADLAHINKLIGVFTLTKEFKERWTQWQPVNQKFLIDLDSPRMESLLARKSTNLMKVCMLLSISESDDLILNETHWEKGLKIMEDVTKDSATIISSALIAAKDTQQGLNQIILQTIKQNGGIMPLMKLKSKIIANGNDLMRIDVTLKVLQESGDVTTTSNERGLSYIKLLVDPDRQF